MAIRSLKSGSFSRSTQVGNSVILPGDYESIATTTVGSGGAASISFTSIPSTFTHLQVRAILRNTAVTSGASSVGFRLNSDSATNYTWHYLQGDGTSATAGAATGYTYAYMALNINGGNTANVWATTVLDILDYTNTNKNKILRSLGGYDNNGVGQIQLQSSAWLSTSAVTRIDIYPSASNFAQYSSFALYGIRG